MHVSSWKGGFVGVLMLTGVGCNHTAAPIIEPGLSASFSSAGSNSQPETATAIGSTGGITVTGVLTIPMPCFAGAAAATLSGSDVTVELSSGTQTGQVCLTVIAYLNYKAQISLSPGTYRLHVVHETVGLTPPPREILNTSITVP